MNKKKTLLIAVYSLVVVVVLGIIACAVIPASTYPQIKDPTSEIIINYDSSTRIALTPENKNYKKVLNEVKDGFKVNFLTGLFNGYLSSTDKDQVATSTKPDGLYITFNYLEEQTLKINGKEVTKSSNSTAKIKYTTLSFAVSETDAGSLVSVYFTTTDEEPSKYSVRYYANLSDVFELVEDIRA